MSSILSDSRPTVAFSDEFLEEKEISNEPKYPVRKSCNSMPEPDSELFKAMLKQKLLHISETRKWIEEVEIEDER